MEDTGFLDSLKEALAQGFVAAVPEASGQVTKDDIIIDGLTLEAVRRLTTSGSRRLQAKKLTVQYSIVVAGDLAATAKAVSEKLVANKAAFEEKMSSTYAEEYEKNTGSPPKGYTGVTADTAGVKVEVV